MNLKLQAQDIQEEKEVSVYPDSIFILMRGFPGTGKSTIARAIARELRATLIDRDIVRQKAVDYFGNHENIGRFAYELMFALVEAQLDLGHSVVVDTPLTYLATFQQAQLLAQKYNVPSLVVHCKCPPEIHRLRLEGRKGKVSDFQITSLKEWEQQKARFEDYEDGGCAIDTSNPPHESLEKILYTIQELHARSRSHQTEPEEPGSEF